MKKKRDKYRVVYVGMVEDIFHPGHLNIISEARKLGRVIVGLLTDEAVASYKRLPLLDCEQRKAIVENIKGSMRSYPSRHSIMYPISG